MTPTRRRSVGSGIAFGALFGLISVYGGTIAWHVGMRIGFGLQVNPFTGLWVRAGVGTVVVCALLGAAAAAAAHRYVAGREVHVLHFVAAGMFVIPMAGAPDTFAKLLPAGGLFGGLIGVDLLCYLSWRAARRRLGRVVAAMAALFLITGAVWRVLMPAAIITADPDRPRPPAGTPNILWVVMDTTRADHLNVYGYPRDTSPHLSALAADAVTFEQAYSTAPWTMPAHASMFTGLYPSQHGCQHGNLSLDPSLPTLAQLLTDAGFDSAVYAGNPWLSAENGLTRGFAEIFRSYDRVMAMRYVVFSRLLPGAVPTDDKGAQITNAAFSRWLDETQARDRPFFAFINYLEPHYPYSTIPDSMRRRYVSDDIGDAELIELDTRARRWLYGLPADGEKLSAKERELLISMYDAGIREADHRLGEVITTLRQRDLLDDTVVIVTSDHGELFGYRDLYWGHDRNLHRALVHVPLVVRWPGRLPAGARIARSVQLVDLMPTVLEAAGVEAPKGLPGRSLSVFTGAALVSPRPVVTQYGRPEMPWLVRQLRAEGHDPQTYSLASLQLGNMRLVRGPAGDELFDVQADPGQVHDLATRRPEILEQLRAALVDFGREHPARYEASGPPVEMSESEKAALRSLGYVE